MDIFEKCSRPALKDQLKEAGIYPYFRSVGSCQGPVVRMEGRDVIMLGSNNYLGLSASPEIIADAVEALKKYGTTMSGSRFLNGTLELHLELEKELAEFVGKEDAMTFPSGFQTNLGTVSALVGRKDYVIIDREAHASIYDACALSGGKLLRFRHNDMADLEKKLQEVPEDKACLIVIDGVYSMSGDIADLPGIVALKNKYGARLMVDDAHSFGVLGEGGRGTASMYGLADQVDILMCTFSKSLASLGGYIAASHEVIDFIRHTSRPFMFSAAVTPASCQAALSSLRYIKAHPELPAQISELSEFFRKELISRNVQIVPSRVPIIPIYTGCVERTLRKAKEIFDQGVYLNQVLPPAAPEGNCMLRTTLMATHTREHLLKAADIIAEAVNRE